MYYEVFIPSPDPDGFDVTITVEAENWMSALKSGLQRTGEGASAVRNVMCDIKDDNTIHVTDASTQRVFVLREVSQQEARGDEQASEADEQNDVKQDSAKHDAAKHDAAKHDAAKQDAAKQDAAKQDAVEEDAKSMAATQRIDLNEAQPSFETKQRKAPPEPKPEPEPEKPAAERDPRSFAGAGQMRVGSSTHEALQADEQEPKVLRETRSKTDQKKAVEIGRRNEKVSESLIEDIFLEIQEIHEGDKPMEDVVSYVMDMAMEKVGAESGSVLFADVNGKELYFATARGPKANEVMDYRVPMGKGIVGFCTREGVSLAISDAPNDPRFYKEISESLGYKTEGLVCAPIQYEGRVYGALELMNKQSGQGFTADEMNALSYMGRQLAQYVHDMIMRREKLE